eukprot:GEMP01033947.1.p1 GENE.GEMP01033947.1~~GEMP01033947.1.p1  ORF type:complete len:296 (+),score=69.99 GEMP01033947.1:122-1009(+)
MFSPRDEFKPVKLKPVAEQPASPGTSAAALKVKNTFLNFDYDEEDSANMAIGRSLTWNVMPLRVDSIFLKSDSAGNQLSMVAEGANEEEVLYVQTPTSSNYAPSPSVIPSQPSGIPVTTMMLRNFPRRSAQKRLLSHLDESGFAGTYDFVYLPFCFVTKQNLGYAFINFRTAAKAVEFSHVWHKQSAPSSGGKEKKSRPMTVSVAQVQGREANVQRILKECNAGKITNQKFQPVMLDETGERMDFSVLLQEYRAARGAAAGASSAAAQTHINEHAETVPQGDESASSMANAEFTT